ncbi:MAG: TIGR00730 family Rossman fold protein [Gemmatales bacterium]|nr:TIGR00730 family Rossman fold protein [Gemmatales bacterium]MDW8385501.1 TIGR00730 family Rossman fold protein [Gemmatales bacterium]
MSSDRLRWCVFCGSKTGTDPQHAEAARELGRTLARRGVGIVYGGGHVGLMGVLADAALQAGGEVIGVIPRFMVEEELAHEKLSQLHIVSTMHDRKALMAGLAHAFVALPGGFGTAEEFFEIVTWRQLHLHDKPIGLLNVHGFFDPLIAWMDRAVVEGFLKPRHREMIVVRTQVADLVSELVPLCKPVAGGAIEEA